MLAGQKIYIRVRLEQLPRPMIKRTYRATLFALYQMSIILGILLLPVALAARQAGISIPLHQLVDSLGEAYDDAQVK